ncbi:MAG: hypothetical protein ABR534_00600 [Desulfotignum sp.]
MAASRFHKNADPVDFVPFRSSLCLGGQSIQLPQAGFQRAYSVRDGFEGDIFNQPGHPEHGRRIVNGWKNADLLWTYMLDPEQIYTTLQ